jgi:hypothetical protein
LDEGYLAIIFVAPERKKFINKLKLENSNENDEHKTKKIKESEKDGKLEQN